MVKIVWSPSAKEDLQIIYEYIAKDSLQYANNQIDRIIDRVDQLVSFPESGRIVPEYDHEKIRELIEGNYRIVYEILSTEEVAIVRIHHSAKIIG